MKVGKDFFPKSSFLATEKDYSIIIKKMLENDELCKLLYYRQKDCLKAKNLTMEQKLSMIDNQIKLVPYLQITPECPIYVFVLMDNFRPNAKNPEFKDCNLVFCVLCHPDHWNLGNFKLRPQKIVGEIDEMLNGQKLTGIGTVTWLNAGNLLISNELMGMMSLYKVVRGIEDEIDPLQ